MPSFLAMVVGLGALIVGAHLLVRGGAGIAARLHVSPLIIGLTIVSLGTSAPELAIGIDAALRGNPELATGNIVGTNIVNILLILGLSALIRPIRVQLQTLRLDGPVIAIVAVLMLVMALNGSLSRIEGIILLAVGIVYTVAVIRYSRSESPRVRDAFRGRFGAGGESASSTQEKEAGQAAEEARLAGNWRTVWDAISLVLGIVIVVLGADWLVDGAVQIATSFGVSDALIGLTIVAIGTSAPELVTTVVSTFKGERDIAIGNLIGSSVYNIVFIMGATMVVAPAAIAVPPEVLRVDLVVMTAVAVLCVPVFATGRTISRLEGGLFVGSYLLYLTYLILLRT